MNAIVFHKWHMVDAWRTDNREGIDKYNPDTRTATMKNDNALILGLAFMWEGAL